MSDYLIAPSILAANFARLGEEVDAVLAAGALLGPGRAALAAVRALAAVGCGGVGCGRARSVRQLQVEVR